MLAVITALFETMGQAPNDVSPGAVGFGSLTVPGSSAIVQRLIEYARDGNTLATPLGQLTIENALPQGGVTPRLLLTGMVDCSPWSYAPPIPPALVDFAAGRPAVFGSVTVEVVLELPHIAYHTRQVHLTFPQPIKVWRTEQSNRGFLRRKLDSFFSTTLTGIILDQHGGELQLTGAADWLAPRLIWGD